MLKLKDGGVSGMGLISPLKVSSPGSSTESAVGSLTDKTGVGTWVGVGSGVVVGTVVGSIFTVAVGRGVLVTAVSGVLVDTTVGIGSSAAGWVGNGQSFPRA